MRKSEILVKVFVWGAALLFREWFRSASEWFKIKDNKMPARISVRPFRADDIERILQIERASFGADAYDRKLFAELFDQCGELFLVAVTNGRICGYMVTCMRGRKLPNAAEVVSIAVHPASRGRGAASSLLRNTLRRLRLQGATRLTLMVKVTNENARRFYENNAFERVRKVPGYYEDGTDGLLMRKELMEPDVRRQRSE